MKKNWNWTQKEEKSSLPGSVPVQSRETQNLPSSSTAFMGPLSYFYRDMDRMFDSAFRNFGLPSVFGSNFMQEMAQEMAFNPNIDISSTDKEYKIEVETPGITENDIRIDLTHDGQLCICGEKRLENDKQEKNFHHVERAYGSFSRTLSLPEDIDRDNIQANFSHGVLTITAPRLESQASRPRRIEVNGGDSGARASQRNRSDTGRQGQEGRQDNVSASNPKRAA